MTGRLRMAVAASLAAAVVVLAVVLVAGGGDADAEGPAVLGWQGTPQVFTPDTLPEDRVLAGRLRNTSLRDVDIDVKRVRVLDEDGGEVKSAVRFLQAFAHGLYPPDERDESQIGDFEKRRLGEIATLKPGQSVPITLSWRGGPGERVDFGVTQLQLP
jgi:hypothetical protein